MTALLTQFPRLSQYDPGAAGEGGLDPLGLGAVADRIADVLAPGIRARMSQPRFVTLSAVGAIAYQTLRGLVATDNLTTVDIAFEWLVLEAMVRHPGTGRTEGLPGNQKAQRALRTDARLSRGGYLNGPRVFGFTGVYRPLSLDSSVLTKDDGPGELAEQLVGAWERDFELGGYVSGIAGTVGGRFRSEIAEACKRTLERAECAAPPTGHLFGDLAERLAPREARINERAMLRQLITTSDHDTRNELAAKLLNIQPVPGTTQRELAGQLLPGSTIATRRALKAAADYEDAATALDNAFRRFLNYTTQQHGAVISRTEAAKTPQLADLAPRIGGLVRQAIDSIAQLGNELGHDAATCLRLFDSHLDSSELLDVLLERHHEVQAAKNKLPWIDDFAGKWTVRTPYRNQPDNLDDQTWTHPMRLTTLATLLRETS